jgi:serine/threonine protein phosphatase PrpC
MNERYEVRRGGRVGLEAARKAADAVRPPAWQSYDSLAHFLGSVTACAVGPDSVVIAQVGECRAYGLRDGVPTLLALDHTLPSVLEASGAPRKDVEEARRDNWSVVVAFLGGETLQLNVVEVPPPTTIALVTNGVWRCDAELREAFGVRTHEDLSRLVIRCSKAARADATAVLLEVR